MFEKKTLTVSLPCALGFIESLYECAFLMEKCLGYQSHM